MPCGCKGLYFDAILIFKVVFRLYVKKKIKNVRAILSHSKTIVIPYGPVHIMPND